MKLNGCYKRKVNSKAFTTYPYSDCICLYNLAVRIGIVNGLEFEFTFAGAAEHIFHKGGPTYMQSCNYVAIAYKISQFSV